MPRVEILSQGDEVVTGQVVDTNAAWLATHITELGCSVIRHTSVRDVAEEISGAISDALGRADIVLCTGGLGPTQDDLTAAAVAEVLGVDLQFDEVAMATIEDMYARYGRPMPEANRKQAWLPAGAHRLDNAWGTAPGFAVESDTAVAYFLPGVPREMKAMFIHRVTPDVINRFDLLTPRLVTIRTTGAGESNLQEWIGEFRHPEIVLSYRTSLPENHIKLRCNATVPHATLMDAVHAICEKVGSAAFAIEGLEAADHPLARFSGSLQSVLVERLASDGQSVSCAESCTGGRIASMITEVPGCSSVFPRSVVTYSNEAKSDILGIPPEIIQAHGAVSEPVARAMAESIRTLSGTTFGLSATGIAGPGGGSEEKPVGTVHIALATPTETLHRRVRFGGDRGRVQTLTAAAVLNLLRKHLQTNQSTNLTEA